MVINEYGKQYFLYAKGWYKKSDNIWEDLQKLYGMHHYTIEGMTDKYQIFKKVTQCAFECILEDSHSRSRTIDLFQDFMFDLWPENHWKFCAKCSLPENKIDTEEAIIRRCLSIMFDAVPDNLNPEKDCDFNILPKRIKENK